MSKRSPTKLTLDYLRKRGLTCEVTERFVKGRGFSMRKDIFGGDLMAMTNNETINVQATSGAHHADRLKKAKGLASVRKWLACPSRLFWVVSWLKKERGGREAWVPRIDNLTLKDGVISETEFRFL